MSLDVKPIGAGIYEVEPRGDARVPARFVASPELLPAILDDTEALEQLRNVATLPGVVGAAWAMPDMHMGYGFPIGGVAATDAEHGVVSPGGVGYDINCGVRLIAFGIGAQDLRPHLGRVADALARQVPCGVGGKGAVQVKGRDLEHAMLEGARWAVREGFGTSRDLEHVEEQGCIAGAEPGRVSDQAVARGEAQLGSLGSGNHFMELGYIDEIRDKEAARAFGLSEGMVTLLLHTGSRGFGHQICTDFLKKMRGAMERHGITVPDPQLCCVPIGSPEGQAYLGAMKAAVNFAFANRQILGSVATQAISQALDLPLQKLKPHTVYEVAHNIAKIETHVVDGVPRKVCVHRKGATRAFPPGHPDVPDSYRHVGQPVLIPGDMERASYVLAGRDGSTRMTFGSTCHGAGRRLSRTKARAVARGRSIQRELEDRGILLRAASLRTQQEEIADAYKDAGEVVDAVALAGLSTTVARLRPLAIVKG